MEKKKEPQSGIVTLIKEVPASHAVKTVETYKQAIKAFESVKNPNRVKLYDLYEDLLLDGQVEATWGKRRDNILNRNLIFVKDGTEDEEITKLLNSPDMRNLVEELHLTIGFGHTLEQVNNIWWDEDEERYRIDFDLIPRANVHPEPDFECVSKDPHQAKQDFMYKQPPLANYMLWAGKPKDKGLFVKVAPYIIYKRGAMGDWSQFSEMFGMPFREAIYNAFDDDTRQKLEQMLNDWGAGMSLVHPEGVQIKLHETGGSTSSSEVYERFIQVCDAAIAKTILGNTLTTEQGANGARSLGEVHQESENEKKRSDELFILSILNTQFRGILKRFGFNVTGGAIWYETPDTDWEAMQKKWEVISGISQKVPVDDDFIYEEFDIPKPENYEELKEEMRQERQAQQMPFYAAPSNSPEGGGHTSPSGRQGGANNFFSRLLNFFVAAPNEAMGAWQNGKALTNSNDKGASPLVERVWNGESDYFDSQLFETLSKDFLNAVETGFKGKRQNVKNATNLGIAYDAPDDVMRTAMEQNLFHFAAAKTLAEIQALNQALNESNGYADFAKRADKITDTFNRRWQQTEYASAVNCAERASDYHRLMSKAKLFPYWEYKTIGDDRVREEHTKLNGLILPLEDERWNSIYPPNGWKCRCYVVPKMKHEVSGDFTEERQKADKYFTTPEWKQVQAQHWDINRAKQGMVFDANQMYIRKFPDNAAAMLDKIYHADYGLNSLGKCVASATTPLNEYKGEAQKWFEENKSFTDYNKRTVVMNNDIFKTHTTGKYEKTRVPLLNGIKEALATPDEVWLNDYIKGFSNVNYIKYYKGKAINVICEIADGKEYRVKTWFEIVQNPKKAKIDTEKSKRERKLLDPRQKYRRGLLIKKAAE
jgi:SPP1 gp7 family putative phage head morphogenesis protein